MKQLRFASVLLAAIVSIAAEAQGNITGRVIDEQAQPMPFANVVSVPTATGRGFFVGLSVTLWLGMTLGGGYSMT